MRVLERLIQDNEKQKKRKQTYGQEEDDEETMTYMYRKRQPFLNENAGVFSGKNLEGINTRKSVFDETAVFTVRKE